MTSPVHINNETSTFVLFDDDHPHPAKTDTFELLSHERFTAVKHLLTLMRKEWTALSSLTMIRPIKTDTLRWPRVLFQTVFYNLL